MSQCLDRHTSVLQRLWAPAGVAALAACGCWAVWMAEPTTPGGPIPTCPTKLLFGIDCPGCGSMRMLYALLHGDLPAAARFNALALLAVVFLLWAFGAWTYGRLIGRQVWSWQHHRWSASVTLILITLWVVIRNIPIGPFRLLHV